MRNKVFSALFVFIFLFMFIGAPITPILTEKGIIDYNNVGNQIEVDKVYDEGQPLGSFFNKIEKAKTEIKDTYINNLPFFLKITNTYKPLKNSINQPLINWFQNKGNETTVYLCNHIYTETVLEPTCTGEGYTTKLCRLCNEEIKENVVAPLGHSFELTKTVEPDCETDGYSLYTCTLCSEIEQRDTVKATGHSYKESHDGSVTLYTCEKCSHSYSVSAECAHPSFKESVKDGYTLYECEACDYSYTDVNAEHTHSFTTEKIEPTCEKQGVTRKVCTECGYVEESEPVAPTGHKYSAKVIAPTCTSEGYTLQTCQLCSAEKKTDIQAPKGHSYDTTTVAPTYESKGYDLHVCPICSHSYKDNETPMLVSTIPQPKTTADPEGTTYSAELKTTDNIFRHYSLTASYPDGTSETSYARIVKLDRETLYNNMLDVANLVNTMVEKDREVNWYFSFATNIEATEIGEKIVPQESTRYIYEDFLTKLDPSVKTSALKITSFNDYYDKFYITDHHWNHHGSEEAYLEIVRMLSENYPDVKPIEVEQLYEFEDVKFYGSLARAQANYSVSDIYGVYFRRLPYHNVSRDEAISYGSKKNQEANLEIYKNGKFNTAQGYNHYTEFYRVCKKIKYAENNTGRNLLLIGDSYSLPLLEIVSAHFDTTFVRYEDRNWKNFPEELFYDKFIEENDITDVIVIEEMSKSIMQGYGDAYPSGFLNIFPDEEW